MPHWNRCCRAWVPCDSVQPLAGGDYAVDHSATLFFIDGKGALSAVFTPPFDHARLRADLLALVTGKR